MKSAITACSTVTKLLLVMVVGFLSSRAGIACAEIETRTDDETHRLMLLIDPTVVTKEKLAAWKREGFDAITLLLDERFESEIYKTAAKVIAANSVDLYYWVEVGRNEAFAREHPEWMASLGSHDDWRNSFPDIRKVEEGEVAKAWPWTPIAYGKAFEAHITRIKELLERVPNGYRGLLLNDLQGGPSSCGCGNLQCRWALDYGVPVTAEKLAGNDIAARFLAEVSQLADSKEIVPVWVTECDQEDMAIEKQANGTWTTGYCGHVDCFNYCLDRFSEQWSALLAMHRGPIGVLLLHKEFRRDREEYGPAGDWVTRGVQYLKQDKLKALPPEELWLVIQGYNVPREAEEAAIKAAGKAGAGRVIVARTRIDQSYEPRVMQVKGETSGLKASRMP